MSFSEYLTPDHGYPLLLVIFLNATLLYLTHGVVQMRKKHKIPYPIMYSKDNHLFNCYQRAHQNTLEWMPMFYGIFVPAAIVYPKIASIFGVIYVISRYPYAWGYYTGDPDKRSWGFFGEFGILGLFLLVAYVTLSQFQIIPDYF